jgi:hypothetical protein
MVNTAVLFFAMLIPWVYSAGVEGDIRPSTFSLSLEWISLIVGAVNYSFKYVSNGNIDGFTIRIILLGVDALLLLLYLAYNVLVLRKKKKEYKSRIAIPTILVSMCFLFWLWIMLDFPFSLRMWAEPMLGLWLISLSLLSSAVLEWVNARQGSPDLA